jgi:hypothetical protein
MNYCSCWILASYLVPRAFHSMPHAIHACLHITDFHCDSFPFLQTLGIFAATVSVSSVRPPAVALPTCVLRSDVPQNPHHDLREHPHCRHHSFRVRTTRLRRSNHARRRWAGGRVGVVGGWGWSAGYDDVGFGGY